MPGLRRLGGKQVVGILEKLGFELVRVRGSHHQLKSDSGSIITVPVHGNQPLKIGTLKSIYRHICMVVDESEVRPYFYAE